MKKLTLFLVALTMILYSCKPEIEKPTVVTKSVGEVTETTAMVVGQVTEDGGAEVSERGVCWNTEGTPTVLDFRVKDVEGGLGIFTSNISDLAPNTQYYARAYATNEAGTSYGEEKTFTTLEVTPEDPETPVDPEEPEDPEQPEEPENPETPVDPEEPEDPENPEEPENPETPVDPEEPENPEQPEQPEDPKGLPIVITGEVYSIDLDGATCGGEVISSGDAPVVASGICWNTTGNPTFSDKYTIDGSNVGTFKSYLTDLIPNTQYYVRAYATNALGTAYGEEVSFTTLKKELPTVTTAEVTNITASSATCDYEVTDDGNNLVKVCGICWSVTPNPTIDNNKTVHSHIPYYSSCLGSHTADMTNLEHNTTYYVRAYATNEEGTAYGEEVSFTTFEKLLPTVITGDVTDITASSAKCSGEVTFDGNASVIELGHCWSTEPNPTIEDTRTGGITDGPYTSSMTYLEQNTTYYVRAYATNEVGTSYGEEVSFTTLERITNGYEYVDLGLSVKWATYNVGATSPEEYGDYFAWGETSTKETYTSNNCTTYGVPMGDISGNAQYDAARANWGGDWRMPTLDEMKELKKECSWTLITQNGVKGYEVTGPSGASIFLPAAGYHSESVLIFDGEDGHYWSSTPYGDNGVNSCYLNLDVESWGIDLYSTLRYLGKSVRPVLD